MSIDPNDLIQASQNLYEASSGALTGPNAYIPTTSAGSVGFMVMSYPGRPPMGPMQGMPPSMSMPYMQLGGPPPLMQAMSMPMPPHHLIQAPPMPAMSAPPIRYRPQHHAPPVRPNAFPKRPAVEPTGPPVTVFVGNITERAPDAMIRHILAACGFVVSWKRVQAFGFCEFGSPDSGLRAIRLLHDMDLGGKKLVVKVDAKTKTVLDEYKAERRKKIRGQSPLQDENPDEEDYMDDSMKQSDKTAHDRILLALDDYETDMNNFAESLTKSERAKAESKDRKMSRTQEKLLKLSQGEGGPNDMMLDDVDLEEGKRDLITREIGKFREIMKRQEEEKEVERRKRDRDREERDKRDAVTPSRARSPMSGSSPTRSREATRSPSLESAYSNKIRSKGRERARRSHSRDRERERERERDRESHRDRDRDRDRDRESRSERDREREDALKKSEREVHREKEMEEEAKEKKKADRKAKEKEAAYQERLRNWETRERRKKKDDDKEKEREKLKDEEREREAKRLKEFLEDYDDERDDAKYYKGRELQRRLVDRKKELELDARDRQKEKEELEELKTKIFSEDHHDPSLEFERLRQEVEDQYIPKIIINVNLEQTRQRERERERERERDRVREELRLEEEALALAKRTRDALDHAEPPINHHQAMERAEREAPLPQTEMIESDDEEDNRSPSPAPPQFDDETSQMSVTSSGADDAKPALVMTWNSPQQQVTPQPGPPPKKKKLDMKEVFNTDDDDDSSLGAGKKRKLVPLDYGEDKKKKEDKNGENNKSQEEKRKHIKTLIDKIPTDKMALFAFTLDWSAVDNQLMERRIRPWINKKIIEYIGEPEPTLVDFICSKVLAGSAPQGILDDVQMVLDEEAEVFVVKMWRLLIYEIEAKKLGLVK